MKEILDVMQIVLAGKRSLNREPVTSDETSDLTTEQLANLRKREPFAEFMEQSAQYTPSSRSSQGRVVPVSQTGNITDLTEYRKNKNAETPDPNGAA